MPKSFEKIDEILNVESSIVESEVSPLDSIPKIKKKKKKAKEKRDR